MSDVTYDGGLGWSQTHGAGPRPMDRDEALRLLASVSYGRVVFSQNALPAIRPVNHLVDEGQVIIRTRLTAAISAAARPENASTVVAYEADKIDPQRRTGWSVVVTGLAHTITDPDQISRYERLLHPWVNHADTVIAIEPQIVTGLHIPATPTATSVTSD